VRYICGDICKRDAGLGNDCPRGIADSTAQAGLVDGLRTGRWAEQQRCDRNEPSRRCKSKYPHHNLQNVTNSASVPIAVFFIAIYFV
jgi:hypothetical protein